MPDNPFRSLPKVSDVLDLPAVADARTRHPHAAVADAVRAEILKRAARIRSGDFAATPSAEACRRCDYARLCPRVHAV